MAPETLELPSSLAAFQQHVRESWAELQRERQRAIEERTASEAFLRREHESLLAREADLARRQQRADVEIARFDMAIADRMKELEALDARVFQAHKSLQEIQAKREAMASVPEAESAEDAVKPFSGFARDAARQEFQKQLEGAIADERRVLAEQFAKLAQAQERWQDTECRTLEEIEDLAHVLRRRERDLDERERDLLQADRRRREENYDLWQRRLQLDGWRGVLTAHEAWWHTERNRQEAELAEHRARITRRELAVGRLLVKWSEKLRAERDRLRAEAERWTAARFRLDVATEACDRRQQEALAALRAYAARSLALDETFRQTLDLEENSATVRHFKLLEKRWSRTFAHRLQEIEDRIEAARLERRKADSEQRELAQRQVVVAERNASSLIHIGQKDRDQLQTLPDPYARPAPITNTEELAALRAEVERLAFVLLNADWPHETDSNEAPPREVAQERLRAA